MFGHKAKTCFYTGIFGRLKAYFGTVETQKRGSLHFHCIVWVEGVTPDSVHKFIQDPKQKLRFQHWLESVVAESMPDKPTIRTEPAGCYLCPDPDQEDFDFNFQRYLSDVVMTSNIHTHRSTCYKYSKLGQPVRCRMNYGRQECSTSIIDPTSGGIYLF